MYTTVVFLIAAICIVVWLAAKYGEAKQRADMAEQTAKRQKIVIEKSHEIESKVDSMPDDDVRNKLMSEWTRD